jgi:hypothetical protein
MLSTVDRDQMRSHFWKLVVYQPGYIPLGIKLLSKWKISPNPKD